MKTFGKSVLAVVLLVVAIAMTTYAQQYPKATGYVNDFANLLTREQGASLNDELAAFEKKTTIEIAVVTVPWLNNQSIEDYTQGLAKEWGVGKRDQNNGVVFLIAPKERKMRIETASGARLILADSRADQIRDDAVISRFKAGNMAQGIIDGTHAIMRALDANAAPAISENEATSTSQLASREWTPAGKKVFIYVISSIVGVVLLLFFIVPPIRRSKACKYVLESKEVVAIKFAEADKTARSSDVKEETREKLAKLKDKFSSIDRLTATSEGANWLELREKLNSMDYQLSQIVFDIKCEIAFAEEARREGPELLKKIPDMIEAAEKKLAEGKSSPKAVEYLEQARTQYAQVQSQRSGIPMTNWVILYLILTNIQSNTANAESAHQYANTDHSNDYSSRSRSSRSRSSSGYGFGSSGGFGGGGGFRGGGSSGSW
ncbi:MAG: TPM domain-containing protein [Candidatus Niyogibacteria bacterium]|nr:TPM domain-containing protein [Candidatus Niyogibacteria bacterium]